MWTPTPDEDFWLNFADMFPDQHRPEGSELLSCQWHVATGVKRFADVSQRIQHTTHTHTVNLNKRENQTCWSLAQSCCDETGAFHPTQTLSIGQEMFCPEKKNPENNCLHLLCTAWDCSFSSSQPNHCASLGPLTSPGIGSD